MEQEDKYVLTALSGFVVGAGLIGLLGLGSSTPFNNAKVFHEENKTPVMRLYRKGGDQILVGESNNYSGETYIKLETHLKNFKETADKNIERARIEKLVKWYD